MRTEPKEAEDGKIWVSGWGNTEARVMIVTSHPSVEDLRAGFILSQNDDDYGPIDEIKEALKASGLKKKIAGLHQSLSLELVIKINPILNRLRSALPNWTRKSKA